MTGSPVPSRLAEMVAVHGLGVVLLLLLSSNHTPMQITDTYIHYLPACRSTTM